MNRLKRLLNLIKVLKKLKMQKSQSISTCVKNRKVCNDMGLFRQKVIPEAYRKSTGSHPAVLSSRNFHRCPHHRKLFLDEFRTKTSLVNTLYFALRGLLNPKVPEILLFNRLEIPKNQFSCGLYYLIETILILEPFIKL